MFGSNLHFFSEPPDSRFRNPQGQQKRTQRLQTQMLRCPYDQSFLNELFTRPLFFCSEMVKMLELGTQHFRMKRAVPILLQRMSGAYSIAPHRFLPLN